MYQKITADQLFNGHHIVQGNPVLVLDKRGTVLDVIDKAEAGDDVLHISGILSPGFVNAHCHLELSHLLGSIEEGQGLIPFITSIMGQRKADVDMIQLSMEKADEKMKANGIVAVGDICNSAVSIAVKQQSPIHYHSFVEIAGFPEDIARDRFVYAQQVANDFLLSGLSCSIVPHAPYSVSDTLMSMICRHDIGGILSIHNQETADENAWFHDKQGGFNSFYQKLNIDTKAFEAKGKSSLAHFIQFLNAEQKNILVHNVYTSSEDLDIISETFMSYPDHLFFCLCPNANQYISRKLPDVDILLRYGVNIVLGTDSLASNHQLDLMHEMLLLREHFPQLTTEQMLPWVTFQGAKALGIESTYGSFEKGKRPGVVAIEKGKASLILPV